ncbi:hypothetical protein [Pseudomonas fulva]|uniref:Transmembrane protein n=1 Tax=Pseudomonas fulva (strain 12-X) TaxID=743720 RepID=F6AD82_PSEF1|nr:hypothetical protein [Pseudomonas fulva]AEF23459.1 hypothetical protein Psefu_3497 [Pseudomonas fulva 12-X]
MKYVFLLIWFVFSGVTLPFAVFAIYRTPASWGPYSMLVVCGFISLCTLRLIQEGYRSAYARGASRLSFWLGLLFLPLTLVPLYSAYETWLRGYYVASSYDGHRTRLVGAVLEMLQHWVGYWGPIFVLVVFSLSMAVLLWRVLISSR